jgi:hypothetical protein
VFENPLTRSAFSSAFGRNLLIDLVFGALELDLDLAHIGAVPFISMYSCLALLFLVNRADLLTNIVDLIE